MIDRIFFACLLPLPLIVAALAIVYARRARATVTPRLRWSRIVAAGWLAAAAGVLLFARERVRGWSDYDNATLGIIFISAIAAGVIGTALLGLAAAVGRSTKGIPLCPRCWYDMGGGGTTCPECGNTIRSRSDLVLRKRWPLVVAVAVTLQLAGQFSYQVVRADHSGVQSFVPTTALVAGMFSLPEEAILGSSGPFDNLSLTGRIVNNRSANWQKSWAFSKAVAALGVGSPRDSVVRAATILNRSKYDGEIPIESWTYAVKSLTQSGDPASEALGYITECYLRSRCDGVATVRFATPTDPDRCASELRPLVPLLLATAKRAPTRSEEWWSALQLLALAGDDAAPILRSLEIKMLAEESDMARGTNGAVLALLTPRFPAAGDAAIDGFRSLDPSERPRVLSALCRNGADTPDLTDSFRALSVCGEPQLEVLGACGLACAPSTRCEGVEALLAAFERHRRLGVQDVGMLYWPVLRSPDDGASSRIIAFLEEQALAGTQQARLDAIGTLAAIARTTEARSEQIIPFLALLGNDHDRALADRARTAAMDLRTAGTPVPPPRRATVR